MPKHSIEGKYYLVRFDEENEEEVGGFNREQLESRLTGKTINPSTFPNFDLLRGGTAEDVTLYNSALPLRATEYILEKLVGGGDDGLVYQAYKKGRPAKKCAIKIMTWIVDIDVCHLADYMPCIAKIQ